MAEDARHLSSKLTSHGVRLRQGLRLWNEARRSASYADTIFIWIPKNAGTSVSTMLQKNGLVKLNTTRSIRLSFRNSGRVTFGHMDLGALVELELISRAFVESAFKFAFSRNPYSRAISLYRYLSKTNVLENWHERPSFRDLLRMIADGYYDRIGAYNGRGLSQCNPQVQWLKFAWPDKIYRLENLSEFAADISDRWGIPKPDLLHLNQSHGDIDLAREDRALIEKIYAEDFDTFGYAKL